MLLVHETSRVSHPPASVVQPELCLRAYGIPARRRFVGVAIMVAAYYSAQASSAGLVFVESSEGGIVALGLLLVVPTLSKTFCSADSHVDATERFRNA